MDNNILKSGKLLIATWHLDHDISAQLIGCLLSPVQRSCTVSGSMKVNSLFIAPSEEAQIKLAHRDNLRSAPH
jgi:hypothetical protein